MVANKPIKNLWSILICGSSYYFVALMFAMSHVESKFIMDGFSHVFMIANWETFSEPMGRHVLLLHQLIPVLWAKFGATTMAIMEAYVIGDVLYYFSIFLVLLLVLRDRWAALLAVSVHVFGMFYNHFMMVGELHPGSMFAIMALSIIISWSNLSSWKRALLLPAIFFTVSSHPLALVSFLVSVWLWRLATDKDVAIGYLRLISLSLFTLLLKWVLLDNYDQQTLGSTIRTIPEAMLVLINPGYLLNFILFFLFSSPIVAIMGLFGTIYLIAKQKYVSVLLFFGFQIGWTVLVQQYLDFSYFSFELIHSMMHDRYLFPMRFSVLGLVLMVIIPAINWPNSHAYIMASWMLGVPFLFLSAQKADRTIAELRNTVIEARKQGVTKGYYSVERYCDNIYIHTGSFFATFILSSIDTEEPCHVIHASNQSLRDIRKLKAQELLLMDGVPFDIKMLNNKRFRIDTGPYKQLNYSCNNK